MARVTKVHCQSCEAKMQFGAPFCPRCERPTDWATHEERVAWEVREWRAAQPDLVHAGAPARAARARNGNGNGTGRAPAGATATATATRAPRREPSRQPELVRRTRAGTAPVRPVATRRPPVTAQAITGEDLLRESVEILRLIREQMSQLGERIARLETRLDERARPWRDVFRRS